MTSSRTGVSGASSSVLAPRSVRLSIGWSLGLDVVRRGAYLAVDHDADAESDHRQEAGDDRPLDRRGAAGPLGAVAQPLDAQLHGRPHVGDEGIVDWIQRLHGTPRTERGLVG